MKILLLGSPKFAIKPFLALKQHFEIVAIITQPDQPCGRGLKLKPPAIKTFAQKYHFKLFQPQKIITIYQQLKKINFDVLLVCAYGQLVPSKILKLAKIIALNIHSSLLPKYHGPAPIIHTILKGESETGITLIKMGQKFDNGEIIFTNKIKINHQTSSYELNKLLSNLIAQKLPLWIKKIVNKQFKLKPQKHNSSCYAKKITKADAMITTKHTTWQVQRMIKAFNPFPGAYLFKNNLRIKLFDYGKKGIKLKTSNGVIYITKLQLPGSKILNYQEFLNGNPKFEL